ncbi:hypothetical protein ACFXDJ_28480 [Streptomyces sp. NPDC059443]|uniref:hypothetical protein n=1 Tax=unclassified Streptomyces TaxID=2593676 RepID=UPI0036AFAB85
MLDFLIGLFGGALATSADEQRRSRKRARKFAAGEEVCFEACVLGDRPYCRPEAMVFLWASGGEPALHMTPTEVPGLKRSRLPADRLELTGIRRRERTDSPLMRDFWRVAECRDGDTRILIGCDPAAMTLLSSVLERAATATG